MWAQIAALTAGGLLKGFGGSSERDAQRSQMNKMIDTEQEFRRSLQANRESLRSDTRSGMTDAFIGMQTTNNQGASSMMKSAYDNVSSMGRQGMSQYDKEISQSVKMQQQLEAQKPKAYGASDFLSDFVGGGIQGYQAADSFEQAQASREDADMFRKQSVEGFQAWMDALKRANVQSESLINNRSNVYQDDNTPSDKITINRNDYYYKPLPKPTYGWEN